MDYGFVRRLSIYINKDVNFFFFSFFDSVFCFCLCLFVIYRAVGIKLLLIIFSFANTNRNLMILPFVYLFVPSEIMSATRTSKSVHCKNERSQQWLFSFIFLLPIFKIIKLSVYCEVNESDMLPVRYVCISTHTHGHGMLFILFAKWESKCGCDINNIKFISN